jgi:hypothetical protein
MAGHASLIGPPGIGFVDMKPAHGAIPQMGYTTAGDGNARGSCVLACWNAIATSSAGPGSEI